MKIEESAITDDHIALAAKFSIMAKRTQREYEAIGMTPGVAYNAAITMTGGFLARSNGVDALQHVVYAISCMPERVEAALREAADLGENVN